jgi:hypothetical protein
METKNIEDVNLNDNIRKEDKKNSSAVNWIKFIGILVFLALMAKLLSWLLG